MRTWLAALLLALMSSPLSAQAAPRIDRGVIVEYGIYRTHVVSSVMNADGIGSNDIDSAELVASTDQVPAALTRAFGFRYRIDGAPKGQVVEVRKVLIFPGAGLHAVKGAAPVQRVERRAAVALGELSYTDYRFDEPFELAPGTWTFQLWHGGRLLIEKRFVVFLDAGPIS